MGAPVITTDVKQAVEQSSITIVVGFEDEDGAVLTPKTLTWTLTDENGNAINSREGEVLVVASSVNVTLKDNDLLINADELQSPVERRFLVEGTYDSTYGTDLPLKEECIFYLRNLIAT